MSFCGRLVTGRFALNGAAVQVKRIDPDTGQERVSLEIREDTDPIGM